jgi:hypothetical protein
LNCGLARDRGIDLTSITRPMPDSRKRSTNSTIVLVEWPMVKKMFVSSLQWTKAHDEPAGDSKRGLPESKARFVGKIPRFLRNR